MRRNLFATTLLIVLCLSQCAWGQLPIRHEFLGPVPQATLGRSVAMMGDIDGDGFEDFAVGAEGRNGIPFIMPPTAGMVYFFSGKTGSIIRVVTGPLGEKFGVEIAAIDDVDNDGIKDLVVGRPFSSTIGILAGALDILSGATGVVITSLFGGVADERLGQHLAGIGDVDGDGAGDFLAGIGQFSTTTSPNPTAGTVNVISGATLAILASHTGSTFGEQFGNSLDGLGDITGDGVSDYIIGSPANNAGGQLAGAAYVYSGATHTVIRTLIGDAPARRLGTAVAGVGDVNGDGALDYAISDPGHRLALNVLNTGRVRIFSGSTHSLIFSMHGTSAGDSLGYEVTGGGDLNGDGLCEVAAAIAGESAIFGSVPIKASAIVIASTSGLLVTFDDGLSDTDLGAGMAMSTDLNGDGIGELVAGEPSNSAGALGGGKLSVFTLAGERTYGINPADPIQSIGLTWVPGSTLARNGRIIVDGASPFAAGVAGLSTAEADVNFANFNLLIDSSPGQFITETFGFDSLGKIAFRVDLGLPFLAGQRFYFQCISLDPIAPNGVFSSPGMELLFAP